MSRIDFVIVLLAICYVGVISWKFNIPGLPNRYSFYQMFRTKKLFLLAVLNLIIIIIFIYFDLQKLTPISILITAIIVHTYEEVDITREPPKLPIKKE